MCLYVCKPKFQISWVRITQKVNSFFNAKPSAHYFYAKKKIPVDFQVCISVPLNGISLTKSFLYIFLQYFCSQCMWQLEVFSSQHMFARFVSYSKEFWKHFGWLANIRSIQDGLAIFLEHTGSLLRLLTWYDPQNYSIKVLETSMLKLPK